MNQYCHQVETRLVVADNNCRFFEVLVLRIRDGELDTRDSMSKRYKPRITPKHIVNAKTLLLQIFSYCQIDHRKGFNNEKGSNDEE